MSTSVRNSRHRPASTLASVHASVFAIVLAASAALLCGCGRKSAPQPETPGDVLRRSVQLLRTKRIDAYVRLIDRSETADSLRRQLVTLAVRQKAEQVVRVHRGYLDVRADSIHYVTDSTAHVFYTLRFADHDSILAEQRMVRQSGRWRLAF